MPPKTIVLVFLTIVASLQLIFAAVIEPIVEVQQGKIKGRLGESRNGRKYAAYLGIPYAQRPVRFQEAVPPQKWEGMRDGTRFGSPCVQFDRKTKGIIGAEDCLFLNVYSPTVSPTSTTTSTTTTTSPLKSTSKPNASPTSTTPTPPPRKSSRKLPVLVYIHGGSFVSQSGQIFGPKYFMDEDVILITLNYRIGVFGFLSTGDPDSIANLGLRDSILALQWIKSNIQNFGGDPTKVTLIGGGAGGALASYLMISPMAKGLFSKVISQSGNAICPWVIVRNPGKVAQKLAGKLNCPTKTSKEIMNCIKGKGLKDIEIARVALQGFSEDPAIPFAPVIEKWVQPKDKAVVPDSPQKLLGEGKASHIPWLTGYNSLNGLNLAVSSILTTPKRLTQVDQEWGKLAPLLFHYSQSSPEPANVSSAIRQYYFGKGRINEENKEKLVVALTDRNFVSCTAEAALAQSKFSPVYLYTLNYQGATSFLDEWEVRDKIKMRGVVHNDELPFLFNMALRTFPELKKGDKHTLFSEKLVKIWVEFAKNGKPVERHDKTEFEWAPVLPSQSLSSLRWYQLNSASQSQAETISAPTFKVWEESLDLGPDEDYLKKQKSSGNVVVGYTMTERPTVKPITLPPKQVTSTSASSAKPVSSSPSGGLPSYGIGPLATATSTSPKPASINPTPAPAKPISASSPSPTSSAKPSPSGALSSSTSAKPTSSEAPPPPIHAIFKDDDPYSSTTTTTTKKPGFFSKIIG